MWYTRINGERGYSKKIKKRTKKNEKLTKSSRK